MLFLLPLIGLFVYSRNSVAINANVSAAIRSVGVKMGAVNNMPNASIEQLAFVKAKAKLMSSEGSRLDVYEDTRLILTVGIGHKVLASDKLKLHQLITPAQRDAFFEKDIANAFNAAKAQARDLNKYNADFIAALTEVNFQLGTSWAKEFANTYGLLKAGKAQNAINNLKQSLWAKQTPVRVANFIQAIQVHYA